LVSAVDLEAVLAALGLHIRLTREEEGCLVFDVTQDSENPNRFDVYEEFVDEQAFTLHQQRVRESSWGAITSNVERHYQVTR